MDFSSILRRCRKVGDVYVKISGHAKQAEVEADLAKCYEKRPPLAYVDSRKGITNLHVPW